jgi:hypothetical protein
MQLKNLFERIDFLSGLEDKILRKLAEVAVIRLYAENEVIVRQGEIALGLYFVLRGRVKVERKEAAGPPIQVGEIGAEQFFAEMSIVDNQPSSLTVTATKDTECLLLTRDRFVTLMQKYPEIPIRVARVLAERLSTMQGPPRAEPDQSSHSDRGTAPPETTDDTWTKDTSSNGASPGVAQPKPAGTKEIIRNSLLDMFEKLYAIKAFTRFSVALLGCPVEGSTEDAVSRIRVGDVKVLVFPAAEPAKMMIAAKEPGDFTLDVFVPGQECPAQIGPLAIHPEDHVVLLLNRAEIVVQYLPLCSYNG